MIRSLSTQIARRTLQTVRSQSTSTSPFAHYAQAPLDAIIGLNEEYAADTDPRKVIVGVGAYRSDEGKPYVLPSVRQAEERLLAQNLPMEYAGIAGDAQFVKDALQFAYGQSDPRIQGVQALSGTGGLRVFGELLARDHADIYVPNPTWGNHKAIFTNAGLKVHQYRYYDANESALDFEGMIEDLKSVPSGSWVLLHACAHNPTGMDPSLEEWKQVSDLCLERNLHPFFDCAYQGFASGDAEKDAAALRMFVEDGHELACIQSFSKNFGLYGHRVGALSVVAQDAEATTRTISQLKTVIRPMYSNPPIHGARIVSTILQDDALSQQWSNECRDMAHRIHGMRTALKDALRQAGSTRNWDHVTKQIGMFAFSGLNKDQVMEMRSKHHIYCTADGRISMAGVTTGNVEYIAQAIHDVTK